MKYGISATDYLSRAISLLEQEGLEFLFYASFELRAGIEAQMREYLLVHEQISNQKKKDWKVARLAKSLKDVFDTGEKVIRITYSDNNSETILAVFYYTPVTKELQKAAEKLGNYLHVQKHFKEMNDSWWVSFRALLDSTIKLLSNATKGNLLGVPLFNQKTGMVEFKLKIPFGVDSNVFHSMFQPGDQFQVKVDYLEQIPDSIDEDLQLAMRWTNQKSQTEK